MELTISEKEKDNASAQTATIQVTHNNPNYDHDEAIINTLELNQVREIIENMSKFNQIEVLRILTKHDSIIINENKYGIHINLFDLKPEILNELKSYINYVNKQEIQLDKIEQQKESFINTYFPKDNKDNASKYAEQPQSTR
jgi:hypothetical protein